MIKNKQYLKKLKLELSKKPNKKFVSKQFTYRNQKYSLEYNATKGFKLFKV